MMSSSWTVWFMLRILEKMVRAATRTVSCTPWMFNIDPKNRLKSEQEFPNHHFSDAMFLLGRVLLRWGEVVCPLPEMDRYFRYIPYSQFKLHDVACFQKKTHSICWGFGKEFLFEFQCCNWTFCSAQLQAPSKCGFSKGRHHDKDGSLWIWLRNVSWVAIHPIVARLWRRYPFKFFFFTAMLHTIWFNVFASIFVGETNQWVRMSPVIPLVLLPSPDV